jgi:hypothetical protein
VIPSLLDAARELGMNPHLLVLVMAGVLTGFVLFAQSIARWFEDRNS